MAEMAILAFRLSPRPRLVIIIRRGCGRERGATSKSFCASDKTKSNNISPMKNASWRLECASVAAFAPLATFPRNRERLPPRDASRKFHLEVFKWRISDGIGKGRLPDASSKQKVEMQKMFASGWNDCLNYVRLRVFYLHQPMNQIWGSQATVCIVDILSITSQIYCKNLLFCWLTFKFVYWLHHLQRYLKFQTNSIN